MRWKRIVLIVSVLVLVAAAVIGSKLYNRIYGDNVKDTQEEYELFIPTGATYQDVLQQLYDKEMIINQADLEWVAEKKNYPNTVKPGRYVLPNKLSNWQLIDTLRSGNTKPVKVTLNKFRTKEKLAAYVSGQLEADSAELVQLLNQRTFLANYGLNPDEAMAMMLHNTYFFEWNTSAEEFIDRMYREYKDWWTTERRNKAKALGLDPVKVVTLASIVEEESNQSDERPAIAGVYLNRLKVNMPLQADPTVKFALQDFELRRILKKHTQYNSPYNTYRNSGLPPGPICTPTPNAIEAVLNAKDHKYYYFCAKPDTSGYHVFAKTLQQHNQNARAYQQWLNKQGF